MTAYEPRHGVQAAERLPEHGRHADQGTAAAQARRRYLQQAGGGLATALLGTVTRPSEFRARDGAPWLIFNVVPDRQADEAAASVRVEYLGDDAEDLAARLVTNARIYAEGSLRLNTWIGRDGAERTGLNVKASYIEVMGVPA